MNIVSATVEATGATTKVKLAGGGAAAVSIKSAADQKGQKAHLGFRPEDVTVADGDAKDALVEGVITLVEALGEVTNLYVEVAGSDNPVVAKVPGTFDVKRGDRIGLNADQSKMHLFNEEGRSFLYL